MFLAYFPNGSSATVVVTDLHRLDSGGYEIDQQPLILAHYSGASTPSASGMFINEGDWKGRTICHWTEPKPLDVLTEIKRSGINDYYPGSGVVYKAEGPIEELFDTTYKHTLDFTIKKITKSI